MPQQLSWRARHLAGDRDHLPALASWRPAIIPILLLLALTIRPSLLTAQTRSVMQVAASVLPVEPSRTALDLAIGALDTGRPALSRSKLARILVEPSREMGTEAAKARRVRIDFLRN